MGMFIIVIAFFIQTGNIQSYVIWLSVPIVITIGLINITSLTIYSRPCQR